MELFQANSRSELPMDRLYGIFSLNGKSETYPYPGVTLKTVSRKLMLGGESIKIHFSIRKIGQEGSQTWYEIENEAGPELDLFIADRHFVLKPAGTQKFKVKTAEAPKIPCSFSLTTNYVKSFGRKPIHISQLTDQQPDGQTEHGRHDGD